MNKQTIGLILSILFLASILVGVYPTITPVQASTPSNGGIVIIPLGTKITNYPAYLIVINVSNIIATYHYNYSYIIDNILTFLNVSFTLVSAPTGATVASVKAYIPVSDDYIGFYSSALKSVFFLLTYGPSSSSISLASLEQDLGMNLGIVVNYLNSSVSISGSIPILAMQYLYDQPLSTVSPWNQALTSTTYIVNNKLILYMQVITGSSSPVGQQASSVITVVAPFEIVNIYNPVFNNQPIGVGRSAINVTILDYALLSGTYNFSFQLNYTTPGAETIKFAQIANLTDYVGVSAIYIPTTNFWSGYYPVEGIIVPSYTGLSAILEYPNGTPTTQSIVISPLSTPLPSESAAAIAFSANTLNEYLNGTILPYLPSFVSTVTANPLGSYISGYPYMILVVKNNGVTIATVKLVFTPTVPITSFVSTLTASAYENNSASGTSPYFNTYILTTPPSNILAEASSSLLLKANIISRSLANALVQFAGIQVFYPQLSSGYYNYSFIALTPAYPFLNGTAVTFFAGSAVYTFTNGEANVTVTELPGTGSVGYSTTLMGQTLQATPSVTIPYFLTALTNVIPGVAIVGPVTISVPLAFNLVQNLGLAYLALIELGLWANRSTVMVTAYDQKNNVLSINSYPFTAYVGKVSVSSYGLQSPNALACGLPDYVVISSPDDVLDNGNGQFNITTSTFMYNGKSVSGVTLTTAKITPYLGLQIFNSSVTSNWNAEQMPGLVNPHGVIVTVMLPNGNEMVQYLVANNATFLPNPGTPYYNFTTMLSLGSSPSISYSDGTLTLTLPPSEVIGTQVTITFYSGDYAIRYYYGYLGYYNTQFTFKLPPSTFSVMVSPSVAYVTNTTDLNVTAVEPYWAAPTPATISISAVTSQPGLISSHTMLNYGNITSITVILSNGQKLVVPLNSSTIPLLFEVSQLTEIAPCSGSYYTFLSISGLMKVLHLTSIEQLNNSVINVTMYDVFTGTYASAIAKLLLPTGPVLIATKPGTVAFMLTAKYISATQGVPVELAYKVVAQPQIAVKDLALAQANPGIIQSMSVVNVTIEHDGNVAMIVFNGTYTNIYVNGMLVAAISGNVLPKLYEVAPANGTFIGPVVQLGVIPGTLQAPPGNLTVILAGVPYNLGPVTNYVSAGVLSTSGVLVLPSYNATVLVTVQDPVTGATVTAEVNITPALLRPFRISIPGVAVPATSQYEQYYFYTSPIVLSPSAEYVTFNVTSIVNYTFVFYIETVIRAGYNVTSGPIIVANFQTVVPAPELYAYHPVEVPVQLSQITVLPPGTYTVEAVVVPYASGPALSLYPTTFILANVTIVG